MGVATALFLLADAAFLLWPGQARMQGVAAPRESRHPVADLKHALHLVWFLPGLTRAILQASGVNVIIGATLATAAAMMTGFFDQSE